MGRVMEIVNKAPAWSYSGISMFDQCPKKYFHLRVAKDISEPPSDAMMYGTDVHLAAEEYIRDGKPIPKKYAYMQPFLTTLNNIKGQKFCELEMGIKRVDDRLEPCGFRDKDVWYRGIVDLLIVDDEKGEARVVDYKTGKSSRYADTKQLALMAACVFLHFPQVKTVKSGLLFVVCRDFIKADYEEGSGFDIFDKLEDTIVSRETAYETGVFNPKKNFTCRAWCPVLICPHNGRNE
jgi:hypothetical protein